jgi:hypothetical protein
MMVLQHILVVLCKMFSITPLVADGYVEKNPFHGPDARQI